MSIQFPEPVVFLLVFSVGASAWSSKSEAPNYIIDLCCEQLKADGRALDDKFSRWQALMDICSNGAESRVKI